MTIKTNDFITVEYTGKLKETGEVFDTTNEETAKKITEALTVPLPETDKGSFSLKGLKKIQSKIDWADAVLIGPGETVFTHNEGLSTASVLVIAIKACFEAQ